MRVLLAAILILLAPAMSAKAQISMGISVGINVPEYPDLVPIPGYPVYYDPFLDSNYFFYDGQYWVYDNDNWYTSDWYNGPWELVEPEYVPLFILRVPVRYYRRPPTYFHSWRPDFAPRWGEHWGRDWEARHRNWDRWNHRSAPRPAPLPTYQRQYSGDRYPRNDEQHVIRNQHYHYRPREPVAPRREQDRPAIRPPQQPPPQPNAQRPAATPRPNIRDNNIGDNDRGRPPAALHRQPENRPRPQPQPLPPAHIPQHALPPHPPASPPPSRQPIPHPPELHRPEPRSPGPARRDTKRPPRDDERERERRE